MFSQASVILSTGGWGCGRHPWADTPLSRYPLGRHHPGRYTNLLGRYPHADTLHADTPCPVHAGIHPPLPGRPLQRTVRILLECIIVSLCTKSTKKLLKPSSALSGCDQTSQLKEITLYFSIYRCDWCLPSYHLCCDIICVYPFLLLYDNMTSIIAE